MTKNLILSLAEARWAQIRTNSFFPKKNSFRQSLDFIASYHHAQYQSSQTNAEEPIIF